MSYRSKAPSVFLWALPKLLGNASFLGSLTGGTDWVQSWQLVFAITWEEQSWQDWQRKQAESHGKEGHGIRRKKKLLVSTDMLSSYVNNQISWISCSSVGTGQLSPEEARQRYAALPLRTSPSSGTATRLSHSAVVATTGNSDNWAC